MVQIRSAYRHFRKNPGFVLSVVLTIALGVGANTAIFTLVHAVLLRSLPVQDPKMLYRIGDQDWSGQSTGYPDGTGSGDFSIFSYDLYQHLRQGIPALRQTAAMQSGDETMNIRRGQEVARAQPTEYVSGNYFETLGIGAFSGRVFASADDTPAAAPSAVMSYAAWQADYASDPKIVGETLTFQNHPITVVGIAPAGFFGDRLRSQPPEFWLPLATEPMLEGNLSVLKVPDTSWLNLIARLPADAKPAPIAAQITAELQHWIKSIPSFSENGGDKLIARQHVVLTPGGGGIQNLQHEESKGLYLLMAICLLVLLVACANVANLLLARGTAQRANLALRMALGVGRARLLRTLMAESLVLACTGGLAGLAFAFAGTRIILSLAFPDSPQLPIDPHPSLPVLAFALALSLFTGLIFGSGPAWIAAHADPAEALRGVNRSTSERASHPQRWLVVFQAALTVVLLVSAGMFTRSLSNLQHQDLGIRTANRYIVHFDPQGAGYTAATLPALYQTLRDKFDSAPEVAETGLALYSPLEHDSWATSVYLGGHPSTQGGKPGSAMWDRVSEDYFQAVGQTLLRGRLFTHDDTSTSQRVAIVSRSFADKYLPNETVIGQHFGRNSPQRSNDYEIVGIVADAKYISPADPVRPMFFLPVQQSFGELGDNSPATSDDRSMYMNSIVLHFKTPPQNVDSLVRRTFAETNPDLPVNSLQTFSYQVSGNFSQDLLLSRLAELFGVLALLLAAVGLYGITSYQVNRRTNEIGVRMALGATRENVLLLILKGAMQQVGFGMILGIPIAIVGARLIASQLYNVSSYDPASLLFSAGTLLVAAAIAGLLPARRAASIEPVTALRAE
jgi:predicted permease